MTWIPRAFFVTSVVLSTLLALSLPFVEPGTDTFVITVVSAVMLGTMLAASAALIYFEWDPFEELL